ncbi:aconitate hydratase AcnA [Puniceicoccales bacterium CK1056]|uniref:Aconitate hydratase n=1 Tax=Oceanipulchritudo coccoides TaxID=2706888 RepID=A0A6B2M3C5_9BACT|nr:aconitate hydratase AcnA [Oceanipulchritudo coccoides]NDV63511.1 aconitate hydratase AcnA [Oceanipulchritudo coccoides]
MSVTSDPFSARKPFRSGELYSLPALEEQGLGPISRLPISIRVVLESVLRNCDGQRVHEADVRALAAYDAKNPGTKEIPFVVSRIVLQDFTGVPLLVDLAAMRDAVKSVGGDPAVIEPLVPVDLVVDHSVQVDRSGTASSFLDNLKIEFGRNRERYEFLKWGQQAFETFAVVPPAIGIVHQVNLEYLAKVVFERNGVYYPDTLVGTDSHTTMINGLGIVGWGVGGIEAEAGMLGQPIAFQTPEVIGVNLTGAMREGVTATDLTLRITQLLRAEKVVGKFVEFYGEGTESLSLPDRATIANMAPEYGATMGFFPIDEKTLNYMRMTGRSEESIEQVRDYYIEQKMFGIPKEGEIDYSKVLNLDLGTIVPSVAGPKRPQDRIDVPDLKNVFNGLMEMPVAEGGFGVEAGERGRSLEVEIEKPDNGGTLTATRSGLSHGSVVIAAITSCTNTSNPSVMIGAGLVAKKAVERGLEVNPIVKTSLAPGSRVVTEYLNKTGLQRYLDQLGFNLVGYGCTTCIGNSGPLDGPVEAAIEEGNLVTASVLSGNRNFEARVHSAVKANFLMSPPLVVAYALAGRVDIDLDTESLGNDSEGNPVYLKDIWPTHREIEEAVADGIRPAMYSSQYSDILNANPEWKEIESSTGAIYSWKDSSTYIQKPPFFDGFDLEVGSITTFEGMRPLALLGDSVTTDHISPAGNIPESGPAGRYLNEHGVERKDFNSFGSRRGNDRIMTRGTFANVRIKNRMADGKEGGYTKLMPEGEVVDIFDACQEYARRNTPLIVFGGVDYGMGSSRDWAAKGTNLLGVKVVVAKSYERIHRSNLIGMGVLPLEFKDGENVDSLSLDGSEVFNLKGLDNNLKPGQEVDLEIVRSNGNVDTVSLLVRIDTGIEVEYYRHGGILPYVLRSLLKNAK